MILSKELFCRWEKQFAEAKIFYPALENFLSFRGSLYVRKADPYTVLLTNNSPKIYKTFLPLYLNLTGKKKFFSSNDASKLLKNTSYVCVEVVNYPQDSLSLMYFYDCLLQVRTHKRITRVQIQENILRVTSEAPSHYSTYVFKENFTAERFFNDLPL